MLVQMAMRRREPGGFHALVLVGEVRIGMRDEPVERRDHPIVVGRAERVQAIDELAMRVVHPRLAEHEFVRPFEQCHYVSLIRFTVPTLEYR